MRSAQPPAAAISPTGKRVLVARVPFALIEADPVAISMSRSSTMASMTRSQSLTAPRSA